MFVCAWCVQDIEDRLRIIDNLGVSAKKSADEMEAKMIEWQTKLVELANAKDKVPAISTVYVLFNTDFPSVWA